MFFIQRLSIKSLVIAILVALLVGAGSYVGYQYFSYDNASTTTATNEGTVAAIFVDSAPKASLKRLIKYYLKPKIIPDNYRIKQGPKRLFSAFGATHSSINTYTKFQTKQYDVFAFVAYGPKPIKDQLIGGGFLIFVKNPTGDAKDVVKQVFTSIPEGKEVRIGTHPAKYNPGPGQRTASRFELASVKDTHQTFVQSSMTAATQPQSGIYPGEKVKRAVKMRYFVLLPNHPWLKKNNMNGVIKNVKGLLANDKK